MISEIEEWYVCHVCDEEFDNVDEYMEHMAFEHEPHEM